MSTISIRIKELIDLKKMNISSFEKKIGVGNNSIGTIINRNSNVSGAILSKILNSFEDVSGDYLLTGRGNLMRDSIELNNDCKEEIEKIQKQLDFKTEQVNFYQEKSIDLAKKLEDCENEKKPTRTIV